MSLRTPRRKISPRARRRYRAIRNFFKRTLSSLTSLSASKVNSSSGEVVPDSNRTNLGHQLYARQNRHNLASTGNLYRSHTEDLRPTEEHNSPKRRRRFSERNFHDETKVLYKTSNNMCTNSYDCGLKLHELSDRERHSSDRMNYEQCTSSHHIPRRKPRSRYDACQDMDGNRSRFQKPSVRRSIENSMCSVSIESLGIHSHRGPRLSSPGCSRQKEYTQPDQVKIKRRRERPKRYKSKSPHIQNETRRKKKKYEQPANEEHQFIADIINKQYKPLSFFGRRASDISQISTPVCRDQPFSAREIVIPESEVSSLCDAPAPCCRHACADGVRRVPSACNTHLNSSPRPPRQRRRRADNYNDSNFYDVVPVKEKTSPKSRRKFIEDHMVLNEVPPSPRTQRPRLILETQNYSDYEDCDQPTTQMRRRSPHRRPEYEFIHSLGHDVSTEESPRNIIKMSPKFGKRLYNVYRLQDDTATAMSSQQCLTSPNNTTNNTLNNSKAQEQDETMVTDKTDKALCEIKDILQNFLQELKKDSSTSHSDQASGTSKKNSTKQAEGSLPGSVNETSNALKNSVESSFNCGLGQNTMPAMQPQFMSQHFANPCCYPIIPMYGPHRLPYLVASPSCVCTSAGCGHNHAPPQTTMSTHDTQCRTCSKVNCTETETPKTSCETDILIREIYNYVAGNLNACKKESSKTSQDQFERSVRQKPSVGKSMHALQRDANVGTHPLRCYSKSCEAIFSRQQFDSYYATYPSYSDSLLEERVSREAFIDYQMPRETNEYNLPNKSKPTNVPKQQQSQDSKFVSALKLLKKNSKKNRKEVHEVCLSEQSIEVDVIPKTGHNFKQEFATYSMHGQEFIRPPPLRHDPRYPPSYDYDYSYDPRRPRYPSTVPIRDIYSHYDCMSHPTAPMYDNPYEQCGHPMQPQAPLCFKEVEVRSIGVQSQKKTQFRLFPQKKESLESKESRPLVGILRDVRRKVSSTDAFEETKQEKQKPRKFFNVNSQAAASKSEPMPSWTERMQKDITKNDKVVSNAMLKKMFHKRNPFSPQNRFMRTIMEKDTPVFKWRPRLFI